MLTVKVSKTYIVEKCNPWERRAVLSYMVAMYKLRAQPRTNVRLQVYNSLDSSSIKT